MGAPAVQKRDTGIKARLDSSIRSGARKVEEKMNMKIRVVGACWVTGSGWSYTEDLDPMTIDSLDDLEEASLEYAKEWASSCTTSDEEDYQLSFYPDSDDIDWDDPAFKYWVSKLKNIEDK